jgi:hypothetical protein
MTKDEAKQLLQDRAAQMQGIYTVANQNMAFVAKKGEHIIESEVEAAKRGQ